MGWDLATRVVLDILVQSRLFQILLTKYFKHPNDYQFFDNSCFVLTSLLLTVVHSDLAMYPVVCRCFDHLPTAHHLQLPWLIWAALTHLSCLAVTARCCILMHHSVQTHTYILHCPMNFIFSSTSGHVLWILAAAQLGHHTGRAGSWCRHSINRPFQQQNKKVWYTLFPVRGWGLEMRLSSGMRWRYSGVSKGVLRVS